MAEPTDNNTLMTMEQDNANSMEKEDEEELANEAAERRTTMSSDDTFATYENEPGEDATDEPTVRFHEVISSENTTSRVEAYIDYVFENFRPVSPRSLHCLDVIRCSFVQKKIHSHLETVLDDSTSHTQTCDYIHDIIDDVLQDLHDTNLEMFTPLTPSGKKFLIKTVKKKIFGQQVKMHVSKIVQRAVKQLELEAKRSSLRPSFFTDMGVGTGGIKKTWSLENMGEDTAEPEMADQHLEHPKTETQPSIYKDMPRLLPAYEPHTDCADYVPIPCLYNLPLYAKVPFPHCYHKLMSLTGRRTTKLGPSTYPVPTFYLSQCSTQAYSKLVKYYNSFN